MHYLALPYFFPVVLFKKSGEASNEIKTYRYGIVHRKYINHLTLAILKVIEVNEATCRILVSYDCFLHCGPHGNDCHAHDFPLHL